MAASNENKLDTFLRTGQVVSALEDKRWELYSCKYQQLSRMLEHYRDNDFNLSNDLARTRRKRRDFMTFIAGSRDDLMDNIRKLRQHGLEYKRQYLETVAENRVLRARLEDVQASQDVKAAEDDPEGHVARRTAAGASSTRINQIHSKACSRKVVDIDANIATEAPKVSEEDISKIKDVCAKNEQQTTRQTRTLPDLPLELVIHVLKKRVIEDLKQLEFLPAFRTYKKHFPWSPTATLNSTKSLEYVGIDGMSLQRSLLTAAITGPILNDLERAVFHQVDVVLRYVLPEHNKIDSWSQAWKALSSVRYHSGNLSKHGELCHIIEWIFKTLDKPMNAIGAVNEQYTARLNRVRALNEWLSRKRTRLALSTDRAPDLEPPPKRRRMPSGASPDINMTATTGTASSEEPSTKQPPALIQQPPPSRAEIMVYAHVLRALKPLDFLPWATELCRGRAHHPGMDNIPCSIFRYSMGQRYIRRDILPIVVSKSTASIAKRMVAAKVVELSKYTQCVPLCEATFRPRLLFRHEQPYKQSSDLGGPSGLAAKDRVLICRLTLEAVEFLVKIRDTLNSVCPDPVLGKEAQTLPRHSLKNTAWKRLMSRSDSSDSRGSSTASSRSSSP